MRMLAALVILASGCGELPMAPDSGPAGPPERLSETGLYADLATRTLAPGAVAFDVRHPLWSDGSEKQRYLLLPEGERIDTSDMDRWRFPIGTRAWKEFRRDGVRVETRLLWKLDAQTWVRVAYVWNDDGTDAIAMPSGLADARGTPHDVPSSEQCFTCHRGATDGLLGVGALQLDEASLTTLIAADRLTSPPASPPVLPGPAPVQQALGYLHANCGHCHNDDHPLAAFRTLRLRALVSSATPEDAPAYRSAIGTTANHSVDGTEVLVVPGEPALSQLYVRMGHRDAYAMPPLGTELVDDGGRGIVRAWIAGLVP